MSLLTTQVRLAAVTVIHEFTISFAQKEILFTNDLIRGSIVGVLNPYTLRLSTAEPFHETTNFRLSQTVISTRGRVGFGIRHTSKNGRRDWLPTIISDSVMLSG
jgi:hypothetical protein